MVSRGGGRRFFVLACAVSALLASLVLPAVASAIDEFPLPAGTRPGGITTGPDGALWFTEEGTNGIGRLTTTGQYTHFGPLQNLASIPNQITAGPDGRLWFTMISANRIGAITTAGQISEYNGGGAGVGGTPQGITVGPGGLWYTATNSIRQIDVSGNLGPSYPIPTSSSDPSDIQLADGRLWFTEQATAASNIGVLNPTTGQILEYPTPTRSSEPSGIIATAGGLLWFTESAVGLIGRITIGGTIDEFGPTGAEPSGIAAGRDGALWFTEAPAQAPPPAPQCPPASGTHAIGRITSGGTITNHFPTPTPLSDPADITEGPDGALWFSEFCGDKIGRVVTGSSAPPPPPPPPPVAVLSVSSFKVSPRAFKAAPRGASITAKKKRKTGTTVSYRLSASASARFTVERRQAGRKRGKKCVKPTRSNKRAKRCTRYVVVKGRFQHSGKTGSNKFHFSGRVGGKKLRPGSYRLVAVAAIGASKSKLKRANFKIIR
jgi:virginiamycin B lyase